MDPTTLSTVAQVLQATGPYGLYIRYLESASPADRRATSRRRMASSNEIHWDRFPKVGGCPEGKQWLEIQRMLGLAPNTVEAYGRGLEDFLRWCERTEADARTASRADVAGYVGDLRARPGPRGNGVVSLDSGCGLSNATMQQRLIADNVWARLLWAGLRLDETDLSRAGRDGVQGHLYPIEYVRALALVWLFAGLRSDEEKAASLVKAMLEAGFAEKM